MAIEDYKITESDRQTNGVVSAPDTLTGDPQENKSIFDRLVGFVADKYNLFIDYVSGELSNRYTIEETEQAIDKKVVDIGAADMQKAIYDKNSNGIVDDSEKLGGQLPEYYGIAENSIQPYTCTGNILSGNGKIGRFKADRSVEYSSFTISGKSYNVRQNGETSIELVSGAWYTFILDDINNTINFNGGGGLSNSKLSLATAVASDVVTGKTFYAGDKELKTGTRSFSEGKYGTFTSLQNEDYTVDLGFKPSKIMLVYLLSGSTNTTILFDADNPTKYKAWYGSYSGTELDNSVSSATGYITLTSSGFKFRGYYTSSGNKEIQYIAIS